MCAFTLEQFKKVKQNQHIVIIVSIHNETLVIITNAHARLSGAWKWISKITELNQSAVLESRYIASVQTRMRMIKLLASYLKGSINGNN
jgi:hypothetical protein